MFPFQPTRPSVRAANLPELASIYAPSLPVPEGAQPDPASAHAIGARLYDSLILFGDPRKWRAWKAGHGEPVIDWRTDDLAGFAARLHRSEDSEPWRALTAELQWSLHHGRISAFGYCIPRARDAAPEAIPKEVWATRDVDWGTSAVRGVGLSFVDVRLVRIYPGSAKDASEQQATARSAKIGRPSKADIIDQAIRELHAEGAFGTKRPGTVHYPIVRQRAQQISGATDNEGYKNEVIRLRLRAILPD